MNTFDEILRRFELDLKKHLSLSITRFSEMVRDDGHTIENANQIFEVYGAEEAKKYLYLSMASLCRIIINREIDIPITFNQYVSMITDMKLGLSKKDLSVHKSSFL